jgi:LacI family transcriptional regulator
MRGLPRKVPSLIRDERPAGCIVECSAALGPWLPPPLFAGTPAVWLDCRDGVFGPGVPTVVCDQGAVVRQAFRELQSLRPAAFGVVSYREARFWSKPRADAFRALATADRQPCFPFIHCIHAKPADAARLKDWLASLPRRTALFCVNDNLAAVVVAAAAEAGLFVPRDIMVLGVDNRDGSVPGAPLGISSVHVDFERAGYIAARTLDAVMHGSPVDRRSASCGPYMTVRRRSTGGSRRAEPNILEAMRIIRAEACLGLRADDVVRRISGSRSLVDLRFREATGHSILDEILHVRLEKACLLLAGTKTSIDAIASFCGFASENSLLKVFRARFGVSMRQWRTLHALPSR